MRHPLKQLGLAAACLGMGCVTASAQQASGFDTQLKLRTGLALTKPKDNLDPRIMGLGIDVGYTTSLGRFGLEVGFQYKSGKQYLTDLSTMELAASQPNPLTQWVGTTKVSVESKKNKLDGMAFRLSYDKQLSESAWSLRGGLQLGSAKFRQEVLGDVCSAITTTTYNWRDTYNGTPEKTTRAISPYLGAQYKVSDYSSLEMNIIGLRYTAIDYHHVAGTVSGGTTFGGHTSQDHLAENKRMLPHLELAYIFRF